MKNLIFGLIAIVFFGSFSNAQEVLNVENIGEFHNLQMENYYRSLEKMVIQKGFKDVTKQDHYDIFNDLVLDVFGKENSNLVSETNQNFIKRFDLEIEQNINSSIQLIKASYYKNEDLKVFLIDFILDCKDIKSENSSKFFQTKLDQANKTFKEKDLEIALISINTGKSSFLYWEKNLEKWNNLYELNNSVAKAGPGKAIAAADVGGATAGAIWGAYGGTAFLPGVGTVTGALAVGCAGGLAGSIGATAGALFSALFN
jgi:hypothetical protein